MQTPAQQAKDQKEVYLPNYKNLDDAVLLGPPGARFTPLTLFVCTYVARLNNLHMDFKVLSSRLCEAPHGALLATNSNFGHACQPGYEYLLKLPKALPAIPAAYAPTRSRPRKVQGDGTCFNSAVEPVIWIDYPGLKGKDGNSYKFKCFPSTGETQIPGVVCPDLSDGAAALRAFVDYLNELGVGDKVPLSETERALIGITHEGPNMMNYKWRLVRNSPRILIDTYALADYLSILEAEKMIAGKPPTEEQLRAFTGWPAMLLPPFYVRETKPPNEDVKVSFRLAGAKRAPRVNVFQEGKIDILGADSEQAARRIYAFFDRLFEFNWERLVCLQPRPSARTKYPGNPRKAAPANTEPRIQTRVTRVLTPIPCLPDEDIEHLLAHGFIQETPGVACGEM